MDDTRSFRHIRVAVLAVAFALCAGCGKSTPSSTVQSDQFIEFKSGLGHSLVAPSQWTAEDRGDNFLLQSSDGHAWIQVLTFKAEGSGSIDEFREIIVSKCLPKEAPKWAPSSWTAFQIGDTQADKRILVVEPPTDRVWHVYVMQIGEFYHAIVLSATDLVMDVNGDFYESIVLTFQPGTQ